MTFSFKKFVELVDQEEDLTEEQITEIFGAFATHDDKQKKIAAQKKAEFDARRAALQQKKQQANPKAGTNEPDDKDDPRKVPAIRPKNATGPWSAAAQGKAAEREWVGQFESEQLHEMGAKKVGQKVKCLSTQRAGKAYAKFGIPAKMGDTGKVTKINDLKDIMIVQFKTDDGRDVYCHIQNLA